MPPIQTISTGFVVAMVGFFSSFPILLQGITAVGASPDQAASGLMAAALSMGLAGVFLSLVHRIPASVAWSTPGAAFLAVTAPVEAGFAGAVAGFVVAGALTVISGLWRPLGRLAEAIPTPLAQAMLAGVLLSIVILPVTSVIEDPTVVVPILITWFVLGRINKLLAVPGAVAVAGLSVVIHGDLSAYDPASIVPNPVLVMPEFSIAAVLGIGVPLYIVTMATQNIPGLAVMRSFGYAPGSRPLLSTVGAFSAVSGPFGAPATCLAAITAAMCASEDSHPDKEQRFWSAVVAGAIYCGLGLFAGAITAFAALAPSVVLPTIAGLALLGVFVGSMTSALADDTCREASVITFVITASGVTVLGLGGAVWGLLVGGAVYLVQRRLDTRNIT
ncbi:benzoate/H(+) symporter BenE family transporter [Roseovarius rhodophyticola]|uniref:Benzoate/H(+) symporter BenE family transporter n=1 Tax=Roseovarius rhodophyticola TaxID=3080827 RepID=A0ABZ2TD34_9RHOB|nr:benzoate/H(+) symporter BenE family transporter [Roseovarius sp. W115]MDV2930878.1 benzoate/H(+) symporter BenE family transporter [Roseovarius sp. W115]